MVKRTVIMFTKVSSSVKGSYFWSLNESTTDLTFL